MNALGIMFAGTAHRTLSHLPLSLPPQFLLLFRSSLSTRRFLSSDSFPRLPSNLRIAPPRKRLRVSQYFYSKSLSTQTLATQPHQDSIDFSGSSTGRDSSKPREPLAESIRQLLPLLKAQLPHYITIHIHEKPYLVTVGDTVRLPFLMHGVLPGDTLRLTRASVLGSRDFTLKSGGAYKATDPQGPGTCLVDGQSVGLIPGAIKKPRYIDDRLFICRAVVMGTEAEPLRIMEKTKRRQRHVKTVKSKHRYTILKIREITVNGLEEVENP